MTNNTMNTTIATATQAQEKAPRKTKRTFLMEILEVVSSQEHKDFIEKEITALDRKKANTKKSDKQVANEIYGNLMTAKLTENGERMTIADLKAAIPEIADFSSQKVSAILKKSVDAGELFKIREKGVTYFTLEKPAESESEAE